MKKAIGLIFALCLIAPVSPVLAQDAVPGEILARTMLINTGTEQATAFLVDYQGRLYLVTARHVVAGLPVNNPNITIRRNGKWLPIHTDKLLFPASSNVDVAVFKTDEKISSPYTITPVGSSGGATMGQRLWFLGYPFLEGLESHFANNVEAPFIKGGTMSAIDATDPDAAILYIDGFNNKGFSGGPILYWDFSSHMYRIVGVVSGFKNDTAALGINGHQVDTNILVNSGILIGYGIDYAMQAIEKDASNP